MNSDHRRTTADDDSEEHRDEEARKQVDAFMRIIQERFSIDEAKVQRISDQASRNGKVYITYAFVVGVLVSIMIALVVRDMTRDDERLKAIEETLKSVADKQSVKEIADKQIDVRERLRVLEQEHVREGRR